MKKITTIMLALMMVLFTQCKKENITDTNTNTDVKKVRIKCEIPMGGDKAEKSDFTNLLTDGSNVALSLVIRELFFLLAFRLLLPLLFVPAETPTEPSNNPPPLVGLGCCGIWNASILFNIAIKN